MKQTFSRTPSIVAAWAATLLVGCVETVNFPKLEPGNPQLEALADWLSASKIVDQEAAKPRSIYDTLIERYDVDGDFSLSPAELANRDFERFDRDRDGQITLSDFPGESGELLPRITRSMDRKLTNHLLPKIFAGSLRARFETLDANADGQLTRTELAPTLAAIHHGSRDAFAAILAVCESWDDDTLDLYEVGQAVSASAWPAAIRGR